MKFSERCWRLRLSGLFHATLELDSSRKTINEDSQHNIEVQVASDVSDPFVLNDTTDGQAESTTLLEDPFVERRR
ncbi:hypothetical protein RA2_04284 [Roseovarius sp. A-2]|uniref:hypothetical protein n=1 Tax=Roseovarius sp. A-2 TaxID=1570360 RepID=UPI0009D1E147|nr:hypothetical protein [Roseovarius sp. A-2]GAW37208.1 hypothetical protein RA2_04284 [Roseovarius sp. A-2]